MKKLILFIILGALGCKGSSSSPALKALLSSWHEIGCSNGGTLDLSQGNMTTAFSDSYTYKNGEKCICTMQFNQNLYNESSCSYVAGTGSGIDPGCSATWTDNGSYTITSDSVLHLYSGVQPPGQSICLTFQ